MKNNPNLNNLTEIKHHKSAPIVHVVLSNYRSKKQYFRHGDVQPRSKLDPRG